MQIWIFNFLSSILQLSVINLHKGERVYVHWIVAHRCHSCRQMALEAVTTKLKEIRKSQSQNVR